MFTVCVLVAERHKIDLAYGVCSRCTFDRHHKRSATSPSLLENGPPNSRLKLYDEETEPFLWMGYVSGG